MNISELEEILKTKPPPSPARKSSSADLISSEETHPVPPSTPVSDFSFHETVTANNWPKLDPSVQLPYIREVGVKGCLETLSELFQCPDYKFDSIQFWFLDVIADCLWRAQDEFQFPQQYQRIIIHWIIYVMELIRDPRKNLTRKKFFCIFSEALMIAEEHVQSGCEILPEPFELFVMAPDEEEEKLSLPSSATSEADEKSSFQPTPFSSEHGSFIGIGADEDAQFFKLPKSKCLCHYIPTPPDSSDGDEEEAVNEEGEELDGDYYENRKCSFDSVEFYKPNLEIPDRFISSSSSSSPSSNVSFCDSKKKIVEAIGEGRIEENDDEDAVDLFARFTWDRSSTSSNKSRLSCPNQLSSTMQIPSQTHTVQISEQKSENIKQEWTKFLQDQGSTLKDVEKNIFINTCALYAIKQFVYDYFYETFQFTLVKLAFIGRKSVISQKVNKDWMVPKILKEELKKPKIPKVKKPKKQKDKKKKKDKKSKKSKKSDKKSKKSSKKSDKKKKAKKNKPTKEERDELARLKKEQERLAEEARKAEENRRLLFPLKDAASDGFYKNIFEHWVKPKAAKGKKNKKGKKK